jgi:beta-fructofuranosidase
MLTLPDSWTWDFWIADTGQEYHLFFLRASRALHDPDRRHRRASVGHAVSADLTNWTLLADALVAGDPPAFDDLATWTGSVIEGPDATWHMFYTGCSRAEDGLVQRIGVATSTDLITWHKRPQSPILTADPCWYEQLGDSEWSDEAWRDPWVFTDPDGDGWQMIITARARTGPTDDRGVVGHARSTDLLHWQAQEPLSQPGRGFGQLEVPQLATIEGRTVLIFSCQRREMSASRSRHAGGGIWYVPCDSELGDIDVGKAQRLTDESLYAGRIIRDRSGRSVLLAFHNIGPDGKFIGELNDPMPVGWDETGCLYTAPDVTSFTEGAR